MYWLPFIWAPSFRVMFLANCPDKLKPVVGPDGQMVRSAYEVSVPPTGYDLISVNTDSSLKLSHGNLDPGTRQLNSEQGFTGVESCR
jgi:hypothetical protein